MPIKTVTIHNLDKCTPQQVFNFISNHLIKQGKRSVDTNETCANRCEKHGKVLKCAAGCLIPDEDYEKLFKKEGIWDCMVKANNLSGTHRFLICELQSVHDSAVNWESIDTLKAALNRIAARNQLKPIK